VNIKPRSTVTTDAEGRMVCPLCRKRMTGWPLRRSAHCSPKGSASCMGEPVNAYTPEALAEFAMRAALVGLRVTL